MMAKDRMTTIPYQQDIQNVALTTRQWKPARREAPVLRWQEVSRLTQLLSTGLNNDEFLTELTRAIARLWQVPHVAVWMVNEDDRTLELRASSNGCMSATFPYSQLCLGQGRLGWVAQSRQCLHIPDVFAHAVNPGSDWRLSQTYRSRFVVPLLYQDTVMGVLIMIGRTPFHWCTEELPLLDQMTSLAAVAIQHQRLLEATASQLRTAPHLGVSLRPLLETAAHAGMPDYELLLAAGLDPRVNTAPESRVPLEAFGDLLETAAHHCQDADFGLHAAARYPLRALGIAGSVAVSAATLHDALRHLVRYSPLLSQDLYVWLEVADHEATIGVRCHEPTQRLPRQLSEYLLATLVLCGRQLTGVEWSPREVHMQHQRPLQVTEHQRLLRAPIRFGQMETAIVLEPAVLAFPNVHGDPELCRAMRHYADTCLRQHDTQPSFATQVRRLLADELRTRGTDVETLAQKLHMSKRTLHRRLRDEGVSFQALLDQLRHELARQYLKDSHVSISELAFELGFAETSAFHRAFKRWTGVSPGQYQRDRLGTALSTDVAAVS